MGERLLLLGGQLEIHSRPLEGTTIDAWLPFKIAGQREDSHVSQVPHHAVVRPEK
jgi:signal transduction histidine kinase